jgi:hypothetical protein
MIKKIIPLVSIVDKCAIQTVSLRDLVGESNRLYGQNFTCRDIVLFIKMHGLLPVKDWDVFFSSLFNRRPKSLEKRKNDAVFLEELTLTIAIGTYLKKGMIVNGRHAGKFKRFLRQPLSRPIGRMKTPYEVLASGNILDIRQLMDILQAF